MDVSPLMKRYFTCLEAGDFVGAATCFSDSARYSHPPYADEPPGAGRHEAFGREEILALFRSRGLRTTRHDHRPGRGSLLHLRDRQGRRCRQRGRGVLRLGGSLGPGRKPIRRVRRLLIPARSLGGTGDLGYLILSH
jgi:hypothetical protein